MHLSWKVALQQHKAIGFRMSFLIQSAIMPKYTAKHAYVITWIKLYMDGMPKYTSNTRLDLHAYFAQLVGWEC